MVSDFQNNIFLNFSDSNVHLVYKTQRYLKNSLFGRFKCVKEFFISNDNYSSVFSSEDKLRIVVNLKSFVVLNYFVIYIKKSKGNVNIMESLNIYGKLFKNLCNLLFFPIIDFNHDKFSLKLRPYFDSCESIINIRNLLFWKKSFIGCVSIDIFYNFTINNRLWLFKNFPTYKVLILFLLNNFSYEFDFLASPSFFNNYDVFYAFFNFSINGLVRIKLHFWL